MNEVQIGIIGVGNIGSAHARWILDGKIPGLRLTALCDRNKSRREQLVQVFPDVPVFESGTQLLAARITDAVIIATPHYFHPSLAVEAFRAGQHVLTEKPAGVSVSDVQKMNEAARFSGKVFGIMFNQRTDPLFVKAREIVRRGDLGAPKRFIWIVTNWYRTQAYYDSGGWRASWNGEGGGVLLNQAPHNLDIWQWIFGVPKRIRAFCAQGKYHRISVEDDATIYGEYENGAVATFITTTGELPGTNRLEISGDRGKLVLENGRLTWYRLDEAEREICFTAKEGAYQPAVHTEVYEAAPVEGHVLILENFTRAVLSGESLIAPGEEGIHSLSISNGAYLSSWTDDWVELPVDTAAFDRLLESHCSQEQARIDMEQGQALYEAYSERWQVRW